MLKNRRFIFSVLFYIAVFAAISYFSPKEIDWRQTFSSKDKIPYGNYVLFNQLQKLLSANSLIETTEPIYNVLHEKKKRNHSYIFIQRTLTLNELDSKELMSFVADGNNAFIAASNFYGYWADTLGINTYYTGTLNPIKKIINKDTINHYGLTFTNKQISKDSSYLFKDEFYPNRIYLQNFQPTSIDSANIIDDEESNYETEPAESVSSAEDPISEDSATALASTIIDSMLGAKDTSTNHIEEEYIPTLFYPLTDSAYQWNATTLSNNSNDGAVFVKINYGKGAFFIHSYPIAFTNYYILKNNTRAYAEKCLSYVPNQTIFWDEYYKKGSRGQQEAQTPLRFILSKEPLKWAYYLLLFASLLYFIFNLKRRQRIIPIAENFQNSSVEFSETIGRLYYNKGDHRDIVRKKMQYFLSYCRLKYNLQSSSLDKNFINKLSLKSGIELERIEFMVRSLVDLSEKYWVSDAELMEISSALDYFYTNT